MQIAIIGAGNIGSNIARQAARAGHTLKLSFSRDVLKLQALADELGASTGSPAEAIAFGDVVIVSVPWSVISDVLAVAGDFQNKVVVDTTNQLGPGPMPAPGQTAAAFNQTRMPGARYTKCFNTLTAGFQAKSATRPYSERVVQWICGDDPQAKEVVAGLVDEMGYAAVDLGGTAACAAMEAPRRPGAVYGEEYRRADAAAVVEAVRNGQPIPRTPVYP